MFSDFVTDHLTTPWNFQTTFYIDVCLEKVFYTNDSNTEKYSDEE